MIFDKDYLDYLVSKHRSPEELAGSEMPGVTSQMRKTYESYLFANSNKQNVAVAQREKRLQSVQYECIKRKLREQYDKKATLLNKRLAKKATADPNL